MNEMEIKFSLYQNHKDKVITVVAIMLVKDVIHV